LIPALVGLVAMEMAKFDASMAMGSIALVGSR
jgi:hypothetical protein